MSHPRELIIDRGGDFLFVETPDAAIVGTSVFIRISDGVFELTKRGVREAAEGWRVPFGNNAKARAREIKMDQL